MVLISCTDNTSHTDLCMESGFLQVNKTNTEAKINGGKKKKKTVKIN